MTQTLQASIQQLPWTGRCSGNQTSRAWQFSSNVLRLPNFQIVPAMPLTHLALPYTIVSFPNPDPLLRREPWSAQKKKKTISGKSPRIRPGAGHAGGSRGRRALWLSKGCHVSWQEAGEASGVNGTNGGRCFWRGEKMTGRMGFPDWLDWWNDVFLRVKELYVHGGSDGLQPKGDDGDGLQPQSEMRVWDIDGNDMVNHLNFSFKPHRTAKSVSPPTTRPSPHHGTRRFGSLFPFQGPWTWSDRRTYHAGEWGMRRTISRREGVIGSPTWSETMWSMYDSCWNWNHVLWLLLKLDETSWTWKIMEALCLVSRLLNDTGEVARFFVHFVWVTLI